jgi:hypothetical protein
MDFADPQRPRRAVRGGAGCALRHLLQIHPEILEARKRKADQVTMTKVLSSSLTMAANR